MVLSEVLSRVLFRMLQSAIWTCWCSSSKYKYHYCCVAVVIVIIVVSIEDEEEDGWRRIMMMSIITTTTSAYGCQESETVPTIIHMQMSSFCIVGFCSALRGLRSTMVSLRAMV